MEFVPWTNFARIVQRHDGNSGVRVLSCAERFCAMPFAQLTWRESLRNTEASLSANAGKLYAMGFGSPVKRSTLANVKESRNWRIWSDLTDRSQTDRPDTADQWTLFDFQPGSSGSQSGPSTRAPALPKRPLEELSIWGINTLSRCCGCITLP